LLEGLSQEEQELIIDTFDLVNKKVLLPEVLLPDEERLRKNRNLIRKKLSRLFVQLGNVVYGERFRDYMSHIRGRISKKAEVIGLQFKLTILHPFLLFF
jgi:hypothetical protein